MKAACCGVRDQEHAVKSIVAFTSVIHVTASLICVCRYKKHHGRAEAMLLSAWALGTSRQQPPADPAAGNAKSKKSTKSRAKKKKAEISSQDLQAMHTRLLERAGVARPSESSSRSSGSPSPGLSATDGADAESSKDGASQASFETASSSNNEGGHVDSLSVDVFRSDLSELEPYTPNEDGVIALGGFIVKIAPDSNPSKQDLINLDNTDAVIEAIRNGIVQYVDTAGADISEDMINTTPGLAEVIAKAKKQQEEEMKHRIEERTKWPIIYNSPRPVLPTDGYGNPLPPGKYGRSRTLVSLVVVCATVSLHLNGRRLSVLKYS